MTTRKILIINQYLRMSKDIEIKIDKKIMPNIDDSQKYEIGRASCRERVF